MLDDLSTDSSQTAIAPVPQHLRGIPRRSGSAPNDRPDRGYRAGRTGRRCVALVDARFWWWLKDAEEGGSNAIPEDLHEELTAMAQEAGAESLVRTYWYTDDPRSLRTPSVMVRPVPSNATDGGVSMLRQMARDLSEIASRHGADRVLIISDDERLLLAVDQAQLSGLEVDMVVDEASQDLQALKEDDPSWLRLLQQADRLVVMGSWAGKRAGGSRDRGQGTLTGRAFQERRTEPSEEARAVIESSITQWWQEESPIQREQWSQEVQGARGIPQELDRQLLLRISRLLGQALSPAEKTTMRQRVRDVLLAPAAHETPPATN